MLSGKSSSGTMLIDSADWHSGIVLTRTNNRR